MGDNELASLCQVAMVSAKSTDGKGTAYGIVRAAGEPWKACSVVTNKTGQRGWRDNLEGLAKAEEDR